MVKLNFMHQTNRAAMLIFSTDHRSSETKDTVDQALELKIGFIPASIPILFNRNEKK